MEIVKKIKEGYTSEEGECPFYFEQEKDNLIPKCELSNAIVTCKGIAFYQGVPCKEFLDYFKKGNLYDYKC